MDAIELSIFASRISAVCEEMGAVLRRAAFSPNIKDRLDFSCAVFDPTGELCAQAAHIPVHLGSMAFAMRDIVTKRQWQPGDMVIMNDPFLGGTHLPDVTLIAPLFFGSALAGFVANRAHHADIGAATPGSMPISRQLDEEGMVIPPSYLVRRGVLDEALLAAITGGTRNPRQARGDFAAQIGANHTGVQRLGELVKGFGSDGYLQGLAALNAYGERLARDTLAAIPEGVYRFSDVMDDDGVGGEDLRIAVAVSIKGSDVEVDFTGTAPQVEGNINCPLSVAAAGVYYVFRSLMPPHTPACAGIFRPINLIVPDRCLVNAARPAAVAAGNVETSSRVVDAVMGALAQAVPQSMAAASQGTMNNLALGSVDAANPWDYYETMGGGMGASCAAAGLDAVQTHMTNTLNTPIEALEMHFPLRVTRYEVREDSGGQGINRGGDGLIREFEFLKPTTVTLLTERRRHRPWGLAGGEAGAAGQNWYAGKRLAPKVTFEAAPGEHLTIKTPGGGGWGTSTEISRHRHKDKRQPSRGDLTD